MLRTFFTALTLVVVGLLPASIVVGQTVLYEVIQGVGATDPSLYDARPDVDTNLDGDPTNDKDQGWQTFRDRGFENGVLTAANIGGRDVLARNGGDEIGVRTNGPLNFGGYTNAKLWNSQDTANLEQSGFRASVNIWVPDEPDLGPVARFGDQYPVNGGGVEIPLEFNHTGFGLRTDSQGEMVLFAAVLYDDYVANPSAYEYTIPDRFPPEDAELGEASNNLHIIDMIVDSSGFDPVADFYVDGVAVDNLQNVTMNAGRVDSNIVRFGDCCGMASDFNWAIEWFKVEAGVTTPHDPPPPVQTATSVAWVPDRFGEWNGTMNWTDQVLPNDSRPATLGDAITSPQTIINEESVTVKGIDFDNANGYNLAGSGVYRLEASSGSASITALQAATAGEHQFQAKVQLGSSTNVTANGGATLQFNNEVDLAGHVMTVEGSVNINHSVVDSVGGGSISGSGTLGTAGLTAIAGDLSFEGTLAVDMDSSNTDGFIVSGDADLSGSMISVDVLDSFSPSGSYTILDATGELTATGLSLGGPDAGLFTLDVNTGAGGSVLLLAGPSLMVDGDYDNSGVVALGDLNLVLFNWQADGASLPTEWVNQRPSGGTAVGLAELNGVLFNWQNTESVATVPEPGSILLIVVGLFAWRISARRK